MGIIGQSISRLHLKNEVHPPPPNWGADKLKFPWKYEFELISMYLLQ